MEVSATRKIRQVTQKILCVSRLSILSFLSRKPDFLSRDQKVGLVSPLMTFPSIPLRLSHQMIFSRSFEEGEVRPTTWVNFCKNCSSVKPTKIFCEKDSKPLERVCSTSELLSLALCLMKLILSKIPDNFDSKKINRSSWQICIDRRQHLQGLGIIQEFTIPAAMI